MYFFSIFNTYIILEYIHLLFRIGISFFPEKIIYIISGEKIWYNHNIIMTARQDLSIFSNIRENLKPTINIVVSQNACISTIFDK